MGSVVSKPCKLCHLLMPPITVTGVTRQSCLLAEKPYLKVLYNEKEKMFKVAKGLCLNDSSGVKQSSSSGRRYCPLTLSAENHHRRDLPASSVFTSCGNGTDGERVSAGVRRGWREGLMGIPLLSSLWPTACIHMGWCCTGMPVRRSVSLVILG